MDTVRNATANQARTWFTEGAAAAIATIVDVRGSSSQPLATRMAINTDAEFVGAVSGGCVEADVVRTALSVIDGNEPQLLHYRHTEDPLLEIGLSCDGQIDVLLEPVDDELLEFLEARPPALRLVQYDRSNPAAPRPSHTVVAWPATPDSIAACAGQTIDNERAAQLAESLVQTEEPVSHRSDSGHVIMCEPLLEPRTLMMFSITDVAAPLAAIARAMGYRVVASDPREAYARQERVPAADTVIHAWPKEVPRHVAPDERTIVVALNHDAKFEDDLFRMLMNYPDVAYIGAIGKAARQNERVARQRSGGYDLSMLPAIHTPIGLDLGGKGPAAIALSIVAEVQALLHGRTVAVRRGQ